MEVFGFGETPQKIWVRERSPAPVHPAPREEIEDLHQREGAPGPAP